MSRWIAWCGAFAVAVWLVGCAQTPPPLRLEDKTAFTPPAEPVRTFFLEGRIMVAAGDRSFSGALRWERDLPRSERMLLSGPLGQGAAELLRLADGYELRLAEGRTVRATEVEGLLHAVTGVRLPEGALLYWLSALPRPGAPYAAVPNPQGGLGRLEQDGWQIEYSRYRELAGRRLAHRLFARQGEAMEFRLVIDRWEVWP